MLIYWWVRTQVVTDLHKHYHPLWSSDQDRSIWMGSSSATVQFIGQRVWTNLFPFFWVLWDDIHRVTLVEGISSKLWEMDISTLEHLMESVAAEF